MMGLAAPLRCQRAAYPFADIHSPICSGVASATGTEGEAPWRSPTSRSLILEQLVELPPTTSSAAGRRAASSFGADQRRRADVDAPGGLADDQHPRPGVDLAADDELLQVAAGQALGRAGPRP